MATGGTFTGTVPEGTNEQFEHCCAPCSKRGNRIEAFHKCVECDECFCGKCVGIHSRLGATKGHTVLGNDQMGKVEGSRQEGQVPRQKCHVHDGQDVEIYCPDHDVICCDTCVSASHANCYGMTYIEDIAKGVKTGKQLSTTKDGLTAALKDIKKARDTRQSDIETQARVKEARIKQVREFTDNLIERMYALERSTVDEIDNKQEDVSAETTAYMNNLENMLAVAAEDLRTLDQNQMKPDAQVFVDIKLAQDHEAEGRKLLQQVDRHQQAGLSFTLNTDAEAFLNGVRSLGTFSDDN